MAVGVLTDILTAKGKLTYQGKDCPGNEQFKTTIKNKLNDLNNILGRNKFLAGEKITYADFLMDEVTESINELLEPIYDEYPHIKRHFQTICELPAIKKYRAERKPKPYNAVMAKIGGVVKK